MVLQQQRSSFLAHLLGFRPLGEDGGEDPKVAISTLERQAVFVYRDHFIL